MKRAKLKSYVSDSKEMLLKEVADMELLKSVETGAEYWKRMKADRKVYLRSKQLHGKFFNIINPLPSMQMCWRRTRQVFVMILY